MKLLRVSAITEVRGKSVRIHPTARSLASLRRISPEIEGSNIGGLCPVEQRRDPGGHENERRGNSPPEDRFAPQLVVFQLDFSLLCPHLPLCRPPSGLCIFPSGCETSPPAAEGLQFRM